MKILARLLPEKWRRAYWSDQRLARARLKQIYGHGSVESHHAYFRVVLSQYFPHELQSVDRSATYPLQLISTLERIAGVASCHDFHDDYKPLIKQLRRGFRRGTLPVWAGHWWLRSYKQDGAHITDFHALREQHV